MEAGEISLVQLHKPENEGVLWCKFCLSMKDQIQVNTASVLEQEETDATTPEKYRFIIPQVE